MCDTLYQSLVNDKGRYKEKRKLLNKKAKTLCSVLCKNNVLYGILLKFFCRAHRCIKKLLEKGGKCEKQIRETDLL